MKKEVKNNVSPPHPSQTKTVNSVNNVKEEQLGGGNSPPSIKSDPDGPLVNGENNVNSNNNCDTTPAPATPGSGDLLEGVRGSGGPGERDSTTPNSVEDKKPVLSGSGPPSNCNTGNGLIKSENDFLDTFDSKDGGKFYHDINYFAL